jgi:hypothetical protein
MRPSLLFVVVLALALALVVGVSGSGLEETQGAAAKIERLKEVAAGEEQSLVALESSSESESSPGFNIIGGPVQKKATRKPAPKPKKKAVRKPKIRCPKKPSKSWCRLPKHKKLPCCWGIGAGGNGGGNGGGVTQAHLTSGSAVVPGCSPAWGSFTAKNRPPSCWRPFAKDSPWNRRLPPSVRPHENSDEIVSRLVSLSNSITQKDGGPDQMWWPQAGHEHKLADKDFAHPIYFSQPGDLPVKIHCTGNNGKCNAGIEGMQVLYPEDPDALPAGGGDAHITFVDQTTGRAVDCWRARVPPVNGVLTCDGAGFNHIDGDGTNGGGVAMNNGNIAGIVRAEELLQGRIEHALFMVVGCVGPEIVYPANHDMHHCRSNEHPTNAPASGQHFYLDYSDAEIDALDASVPVKAFVRALAHYGAFVGDTGGDVYSFNRESYVSYTSQGVTNAWDTVARKYKLQASSWKGASNWLLNAHIGVDWKNKLKVAHPCVARNNC